MKLLPDIQDREELVSLLLLGEILTKRGELGPLARLWRPARGRRQRPRRPSPAPSRDESV